MSKKKLEICAKKEIDPEWGLHSVERVGGGGVRAGNQSASTPSNSFFKKNRLRKAVVPSTMECQNPKSTRVVLVLGLGWVQPRQISL